MRYDDYSDKDRFLFLLTCSKRSLGSYFLAALDADQKLKQDALLTIEEHIDRLARHRAWIILGQLIRRSWGRDSGAADPELRPMSQSASSRESSRPKPRTELRRQFLSAEEVAQAVMGHLGISETHIGWYQWQVADDGAFEGIVIQL